MGSVAEINHCRISGSPNLEHLLDLGNQPLANAYQSEAGLAEPTYPLNLLFCPDSSLVQIREIVDKHRLFNHYSWVTGTAKTTEEYADIFLSRVLYRIDVACNDLILEVASNDGTFLKPFIKRGLSVLGIEPAVNIAKVANDEGVLTLNEFWSDELAENLISKYQPAKVVIARNVIPHVSNIDSVIRGIARILDDGGLGVIEFHDASQILEALQYDSIYHEHLCYFSVKTVTSLLNKYRLYPYDIDTSPISGGSHVIYFTKSPQPCTQNFIETGRKEELNGVNTLEAWQNFAQSAQVHRNQTLEILDSLSGKMIVGFGASARSQTYLNYCQLDNQLIKVVIDNNQLKQGKYTPGSSIPIVSIEDGMRYNPHTIFLLAWNFKQEIMQQCRALGFNGQFLLPFPTQPHIIG